MQDGPPGDRRPVAFWNRQENAAIPAIRTVVNFALTTKFLENCENIKFWRLPMSGQFFQFWEKRTLKNRATLSQGSSERESALGVGENGLARESGRAQQDGFVSGGG